MEMSQHIQDEATYISESFGVPYKAAIEIALEKAKSKSKKKRVGR